MSVSKKIICWNDLAWLSLPKLIYCYITFTLVLAKGRWYGNIFSKKKLFSWFCIVCFPYAPMPKASKLKYCLRTFLINFHHKNNHSLWLFIKNIQNNNKIKFPNTWKFVTPTERITLKEHSKGLRQLLANESPLKMMKNPIFNFTLKALFVLQQIKF